mgnify:CR=1 FL=1
MDKQTKRFYEFGSFRLDLAQRILLHNGQHIPLTLKAYETLLFLVENSGRILEKEELLNQIWPDAFVEESTLAKNISTLRKVLAEGDSTQDYIATIPRRGYRFVAEVQEVRPAVKEQESAWENEHPPADKRTELVVSPEINGSLVASRTELLVRRIAKSRKAVFLLLILTFIVSSFGIYRIRRQRPIVPTSVKAIQEMKVTRVTNTGKSMSAAISPDGKYVAYVMEEASQQSLWVKQVTATSNIQILAAAKGKFQGLTFSPNSDFIYYVFAELDKAWPSLYKIPILGGSSEQVLTNISSPVTFSPDGKLLAFMRKEGLMIANVDGTGVRELSRHTQHSLDHHVSAFYAPTWSPNGKVVACPEGVVNKSEHYHNLFGVRVVDGAPHLITPRRWPGLFQSVWLSDGTGLLMTATDEDSQRPQIWYLSYPDGMPQRITNDLSGYGGLSLTADSNSLATVQYEQQINLWLLPNTDTSRAKQLTFGAGRDEDIGGISWTPDGKIVYVSQASGQGQLWLVQPDGAGKKQLTFYGGDKFWPAVTADGQYIVHTVVDKGVPSIWRVNLDGTNPKQLANVKLANYPDCSPDNKWVVFSSSTDGLWKVPIEGGTPVQLSKNRMVRRPAISPDGKLIACRYKEQPDAAEQLALFSIDGGEPIMVFAVPPTIDAYTRVLWMPNGKGLAYVNKQGSLSNLWVQPLDGSMPKQLTNFTSDQVLKFAWSRDGKHLAISRGVVTSDVVLISRVGEFARIKSN